MTVRNWSDSAEVVLLAVKPQIVSAVLDTIAPVLTKATILISIAAGITLALLRRNCQVSLW